MVVGEGKEENKSRVKRMTVLRSCFPQQGLSHVFPTGKDQLQDVDNSRHDAAVSGSGLL